MISQMADVHFEQLMQFPIAKQNRLLMETLRLREAMRCASHTTIHTGRVIAPSRQKYIGIHLK